MAPDSFRLTLLLALALGITACGSDQKQTSSPDSMSPDEPMLTPASGTMAPSTAQTDGAATSPSAGDDPRMSNDATASPPGASAPQPVALSQAQIAMIAELANTAEVEQGKLAEGKAKSQRVKKFATMMVKHHGEAKTEQAKLFKELNLTPTQSQEANTLKAGADQTLGSLKGADGASFDVTYMNSQVDEHQKVLDTIDRQLLPAATDPKLIDALKEMRETVASHLKEAKEIQAELNKNAAR